jgi:hypothetical protein
MKNFICCLLICFGFLAECFPQDHFYYSIKIRPSDTVKISLSHFRDYKDGEFSGEVKGTLNISTHEGDRNIEFNSKDARLSIIPDRYEIYDISTRKYTCSDISKHIELNYSSYAGSNALSLMIDNVKYGINGIDGACISCIKGLDFKYKSDETEEKLFMNFTEKVQLSNPPNNFNSNSIFVNPGSSLVFTINKKNRQ